MEKKTNRGSEFGSRFRKLRKDKGLSQRQLANILGYKHNASISGIEAGKTPLSIENFVIIAETFDVDLHWLICGDDPFKKAIETISEADIETIRKPYADQYKQVNRKVAALESKPTPLTDQEQAALNEARRQQGALHDLLLMFVSFNEIQFRTKAILKNLNVAIKSDSPAD